MNDRFLEVCSLGAGSVCTLESDRNPKDGTETMAERSAAPDFSDTWEFDETEFLRHAATEKIAVVEGRSDEVLRKPCSKNENRLEENPGKPASPTPTTISRTPGRVKTMADLMNTVFEAIRWVIFGLLPEGLAILSGPPKIGKSWFVMNLCIAAATGGIALGKFYVDAGEVLLLSLEDNDRRLQSRNKMCSNDESADLKGFHTATTWNRLDNGGMADLKGWLEKHPACKLVVIDTFQKIKPDTRRKGGNAYETDYEAYGELQRLALQARCCILVVHHNRKSSSNKDEDPLEQISGSTGISNGKRPKVGLSLFAIVGREKMNAIPERCQVISMSVAK